MNYEQAKELYFSELKEQYGVLTIEEVVARIGKTTIRCGWIDFCDYLSRDNQISEKQRMSWGQVI